MTERKPRGTVLAALVHELVKAEPFDTLSDLSEATKRRAARLRIPYTCELVTEALTIVGRTRPLVGSR